MIKRYSIVSLLLIAFTLVLAHSIVPHHHHDDVIEANAEHNNENALEHSFEHYLHFGSSYDYFIKNEFIFDHQQFIADCVLPHATFDFKVKTIIEVTHNAYCVLAQNTTQPVFLYSKGLRGPPTA